MDIIRTVMRLYSIHQKKPFIEINRSGQLTPRPQVHVGITSRGGSMGVFSEPDTDQGNAMVEMHAKTMSHITGLAICDCRQSRAPEPPPTEQKE